MTHTRDSCAVPECPIYTVSSSSFLFRIFSHCRCFPHSICPNPPHFEFLSVFVTYTQSNPHCIADSNMSSYFSRLSPVPAFPSYTGPYSVGSLDVELPVWELESPSPAPGENISTVQYRVFYPCEPNAKGQPVSWLPQPQREYMSAYTRFLGTGSMLAEFISYV